MPGLEAVEEVVVSKQVVEGTAPPLYIYSENVEQTGDVTA
jgi:ATP-dependent Clp protease ATP-binding subunit ClpX